MIKIKDVEDGTEVYVRGSIFKFDSIEAAEMFKNVVKPVDIKSRKLWLEKNDEKLDIALLLDLQS